MIALVIEDEPVAARTLERLVRAHAPDVELTGPITSVADACRWLSEHPAPDLIFLDIQLADGMGFEIFEVRDVESPVIFTTAHDEFALKAFAVFGIDYLLKPIDPEALSRAIGKFRQLRKPSSVLREVGGAYLQASRQYRRRFLVNSGEALVSVPVEKIAYFVKDLVVKLVTHDGRGHAMSESLDNFEAMLDPALFFRLNRQVLASMESIRKMHRMFKGKLEVELHPPLSQEVVVSQERAAELRSWLDR